MFALTQANFVQIQVTVVVLALSDSIKLFFPLVTR